MDRRKFLQTTGTAGAVALAGKRARAMEHTIETDLLIIGSGFAGLWAALAAGGGGVKDITIVDKASVGRSGMSRMCAGATIYRFPQDDAEAWLRDVAEASHYLSRQDLVAQILDTSYSRYQRLAKWGVKYGGTPWGQSRLPSRGFKLLQMSVGPSYQGEKGGGAVCRALLERVNALKVKKLGKTVVTSLLKDKGRAAGAVGVSRLTGEAVSVKARAVVLAMADCSFRGNYACVDAVTGDGFRLAYDAGARLNNMEFLCVNTAPVRYGFEGTGVAARYGGHFLNRDRRAFMKDYYPEGDQVECGYIVRAMASEIEKGNGPPLYLDMSRPPMRWAMGPLLGSSIGGRVRLNLKRLKEEGENIFARPQEWVAAIQTLRGGARTDANFMTDVPGLFAAGMTQSIDPGLFNGWSTMRAMGSGELAGKAAARFLAHASDVAPDTDQVRAAQERALAPLLRSSGVDPETVCARIQEIIAPHEVCVKKSAESLTTALGEVERIRDQELPALYARDPHELGKAHEAANLTWCAELFLRASLERNETRSDHCRREYPQVDNKNWLKWINIHKGADGRPEMAHEDVPLESYPVHPVKREA
ncbi:MAG TPA: FAD-binding protein [bacterium]|nr:FAD-binding protein [bacterium]